jgi:formate/nitrite transporter FocA (FNT family)
MLALGPFDHVIVTVLHIVFGILSGAPVELGTVVVIAVVATAGNLVGGIGLVATTHVAQAIGARESNT